MQSLQFWDSLESSLRFIVELLRMENPGGEVSTANLEMSVAPLSIPLVPGNDWFVSQS